MRDRGARSRASRLALDLGVPSGRITGILSGRRSITADTAVRLGRYFGNGAQFWLDLQGRYDNAAVGRERRGTFAEFLAASPLRGSGLNITCLRTGGGNRRGGDLDERRARRTNKGIVRALEEVAKRFEEDPTPTDGSFEAACKKMGVRSKVRVYRPAPGRRRGK